MADILHRRKGPSEILVIGSETFFFQLAEGRVIFIKGHPEQQPEKQELDRQENQA